MYPNIYNMIKVLMMPVSTASEKVSCLRHLKTYLRDSFTVTFGDIGVLREFDATGTRRVNLSL